MTDRRTPKTLNFGATVQVGEGGSAGAMRQQEAGASSPLPEHRPGLNRTLLLRGWTSPRLSHRVQLPASKANTRRKSSPRLNPAIRGTEPGLKTAIYHQDSAPKPRLPGSAISGEAPPGLRRSLLQVQEGSLTRGRAPTLP